MQKLYRIRDVMNERDYTVVAPSFETACEQVGVALEHACLIARPRPLQVYLLGYPYEVQLASDAPPQRPIFACFTSLNACYLWVLGRLCAASFTREAGEWIRLLQQVHQLACQSGAFEEVI